MAKINTRKPGRRSGGAIYRFPKTNPYAPHAKSEVVQIWEQLQRGELTREKLTLMKGDGSMDVAMYFIGFGVVANPLHPDNNWRSAVEMLIFGKDIYYRLAADIPRTVKEHWKKHGRPPECGWGIFNASAGLADSGKRTVRHPPIPRHPQNPFKRGSGYGLLVDIAAAAGTEGIDEESWRRSYRETTGKDNEHAGYDMAVIKSAIRGRKRHSCCQPGFTVVEHGSRYSIRFG